MMNLSPLAKHQKGMTLLVALITLVVLMLLGVSAMNASNTMFKLAGNLQFENEAKNRAESALNKAELWLMTGTNSANAGFAASTGAYFSPTANIDPIVAWPTNAIQVAQNEQYIIQRINAAKLSAAGNSLALGGQSTSSSNNFNLFRVTARGVSARGASRLVQSIMLIPE